jgi:hypothetical protein
MGYWDTVRQRWNSMIGNYADLEFVINGVQLTPVQMEAFKSLTGMIVLEPGRYWLDPQSGAMGREGQSFPIMNVFAAQASQAQQHLGGGAPASLSERRQLFNSADLTGIWGAY